MADSELSDIQNLQKKEASGGQPPAPEDESFPPRRGGFRNVFSAIKHVNDASATDSVKQRISDYVTIILVVLCILALVMAVVLPVKPAIKLLPLTFTIGAVVFYVINRLGIIVSLSPRQALIVWQILIAAFWLGVTSAMFVMMACFYFFGSRGAAM